MMGCASVSLDQETHSPAFVPRLPPDQIYLYHWETDKAEFNVDRDDAELIEFKENLARYFTDALQERVNKHIATTTMIRSESEIIKQLTQLDPDDVPESIWIIRGGFSLVNQGSRALRAAIGFGAGGTKLETYVTVSYWDGMQEIPFYRFQTTGGSNAEPGAISAVGPGGILVTSLSAAASAGGGLAKGLTDDSTRTARVITAALSDYLFQQGWIPENKRMVPKRID